MMRSTGRVREDAGLEERIGKLQRSLRDCEIKRLELEKKLFQYNSSNAHISHLKYLKLKNALKDVCEKERKAHLRNQAFLQEFDATENRLHALISNSQSSRDTKMLQGWRQAEINTGSDMSRRIYHPATIFMGRQMSANSSIEHCLTQRKSPQPTKSFSISDPHSVRQAAINSNLTDSCVVPANSDTRCLNKPDKIDVETSSAQIRQEMLVTSMAFSEDAATHRTEIHKTPNGGVHLAENKQSVQLGTQTRERLSPEDGMKDMQKDSPSNKVEDSLVYERLVHNEERFTHTSPSGFSPDVGDHINKHTSDKHSTVENLSGSHQLSKQEDEDFFNSSSDLTVSITDSEEMSADDLLEAIDGKDEIAADAPKSKDDVEWVTSKKLPDQHLENAKEQHSQESSSVSLSQNSLSDNGFIHLLQSIEDMILEIGSKDMQLYQTTTLSPNKKDDLVNLCNHMKPLKKEDLEACCALVVQHLQTEGSGKLFLEKTDHTHKKDEKNERTISPLLRNHLLGHVSFLKERGILKGGVPAGFASALILNDEMKTQQDHLQTARKENILSSISESDSQSCSLPKKDQVKPTQFKNQQDDSSSCEDDSRRGKFLEKKRVAANSNCLPESTTKSDHEEKEDDEDLSDISSIEIPGLMPANIHFTTKPASKKNSEATVSSSESSPEHRRENLTTVPEPMTSTAFNKGAPKIKSKAFWGESEDSSSDIEAMLRPQTLNADADDFDDCFD
ncbi:centrosomal protein kizuna [Pyxicephalus adspersus]|uniref:Centrosomal protein kizuna n=1 Tax=Pyxicephalus adspersus TaxID=30357 RepID=A0AAV3AH02_PYXAD|nr:TPA: hypothetical protein GDO54_011207 [Pyxicephalus adspersus]